MTEPRDGSDRRILATLALLWVLIGCYVIARVGGQFAEIHAGFDTGSAFTRFMLGPELYLLLSAAAATAWGLSWFRVRGCAEVVLGTAALTLLAAPMAFVAAYLPIFQLGATVAE
jgi:hypothetical protein